MTRITYEIDGIIYEKVGFFGCQLKSVEKRVQVGTTRVIGGNLMYAIRVVKKCFSFKYEIAWCLVAPNGQTLDESRDAIRELYNDLER